MVRLPASEALAEKERVCWASAPADWAMGSCARNEESVGCDSWGRRKEMEAVERERRDATDVV